VIRGLDGDRVRVLENSGSLLDASALSFDHAVSLDPIAVERIEVLRGPGALLYGGSAIGGVVNMIDNRIPREPLPGIVGRADVGFATGNRERSGAALVEGGTERFACTSTRSTAAAATPGCRSRCRATRAAARTSGAQAVQLGRAVVRRRRRRHRVLRPGYLGASVSSNRSDYGSVAEDQVRLRMRSERAAVEGQLRGLGPWVESLKVQASGTRYQHTEFDAGVPAPPSATAATTCGWRHACAGSAR
jgi:iron complex outermembrane receptor protein